MEHIVRAEWAEMSGSSFFFQCSNQYVVECWRFHPAWWSLEYNIVRTGRFCGSAVWGLRDRPCPGGRNVGIPVGLRQFNPLRFLGQTPTYHLPKKSFTVSQRSALVCNGSSTTSGHCAGVCLCLRRRPVSAFSHDRSAVRPSVRDLLQARRLTCGPVFQQNP